MAFYIAGIVTCRRRATTTVEITLDERERLVTGALPCPVCGERCAPTFQRAYGPGTYVTWSGERWRASDAFDER